MHLTCIHVVDVLVHSFLLLSMSCHMNTPQYIHLPTEGHLSFSNISALTPCAVGMKLLENCYGTNLVCLVSFSKAKLFEQHPPRRPCETVQWMVL